MGDKRRRCADEGNVLDRKPAEALILEVEEFRDQRRELLWFRRFLSFAVGAYRGRSRDKYRVRFYHFSKVYNAAIFPTRLFRFDVICGWNDAAEKLMRSRR